MYQYTDFRLAKILTLGVHVVASICSFLLLLLLGNPLDTISHSYIVIDITIYIYIAIANSCLLFLKRILK